MTKYENLGKLILLRHGESEWNALNLFTGWVDVRLSEKGEAEAKRGGQMLKDRGLLPDVVHTSLLRRAIHTSQLALDVADRHYKEKIRPRPWRNMAKNNSNCGVALLMCHHHQLMKMISIRRLMIRVMPILEVRCQRPNALRMLWVG